MTPRFSPAFAFVFASLFVIMPPLRAQIVSGNEYVRVEGRVQTDEDRKDLPKTSVDSVTQHKTLTFALSGKAKTPETRTGKWTAYGRTLKNNDLFVIESGEFKIDLSSGAQKVESKQITTTYTPEHGVFSKAKKGAGKGQPMAKTAAASGTKFAGFGVIIRDGDKVVGQYFDPAGIKADIDK